MTHSEAKAELAELRREYPIEEVAKDAKKETGPPATPFFLRPCGARVVIQEDEFNYKGLVIIPDTAKLRPTTGIVVAIGPDMPDGVVKLGDRIICAKLSGTLIEFDGKPACRILVAEEILGIIPSDKELVLKAVGV